MSTDLGKRYGPDFTGRPPHMSAEDYAIWLRLWPRLRETVKDVYFDVGLGQGKPSPEGTPENMARMWTRLNQKRADVIYTNGDWTTILELRDAAQSNAVGRLQMYLMLWREDPPIPGRVELSLATNTRDDDVARLCALNQIEYRVL